MIAMKQNRFRPHKIKKAKKNMFKTDNWDFKNI